MANNTLGPLAPILVVLLIATYSVINARTLPFILASSWPLLLLPVFALSSVAWSVYPESTLRYGLYFFLTVVLGMMLGAGVRNNDMLKGIFLGLLVSGLIGFVAGRFTIIGTTGEAAFAGIQGSKNAAGEAAGLALLVSAAMAAFSFQQRSYGWLVLAVLGTAVGAVTLVLSKATGALIAAVIAFICLLMWLVSRRLPLQARAVILSIAVVILVALSATSTYWMPTLFEAVVEASGKDAGLTGRDLLWRKADDLIAERPWIGRGYNAFWVPNNPDAEYLWREMGISTKRGFNFHNTYREITADLGYIGLTLFIVIFAVTAATLLIRSMLVPSFPMITASSILIYFTFKFPFETFGFAGMHLLTMMLYLILAMGLSSLMRRPTLVPERRP